MAVNFTTDRYAQVTVLRPSGRITNEVAPAFQDAVAAAAKDSEAALLVLDMAGLDYVSSGGLRAVAMGARLCRERGGQLMVAALTSVVQEIFAISRFHQVVSVQVTLEDALQALSEDAVSAYKAASR